MPAAALRAGDFSGLGPICDPLTVSTGGGCTPFADNRIPASRLDPIATAFLAHVPLPTSNASVQNLAAVESSRRTLDQFSVRLDHRLARNDNLFVRFSTFDADETQPFGTGVLQEALVPGFGRTLTTTTRNLAASHTHLFGNSVLNELRVGWPRTSAGFSARRPRERCSWACGSHSDFGRGGIFRL